MSRSRRQGFTLVELLVVIAIIALLIAILLPGLGRARKVAKTARCLANMRAIAQTLNVYMSDRQWLLPYGGLSGSQDLWWTTVLKEYGNSNKLQACPDATEEPLVATAGQLVAGNVNRPWKAGSSDPRTIAIGAYGINGWMLATTGQGAAMKAYALHPDQTNAGAKDFFFWKYPMLGTPTAQIPVIADAMWPDGWPLENDQPPPDLSNGPASASANNNFMRRFCIARHNKAINVAFADNHAETVLLKDLWSLKWHSKWKASSMPAGARLPAK